MRGTLIHGGLLRFAGAGIVLLNFTSTVTLIPEKVEEPQTLFALRRSSVKIQSDVCRLSVPEWCKIHIANDGSLVHSRQDPSFSMANAKLSGIIVF